MGQDDDGHTICSKNDISNFLEALNWRLSSPDFDPEFDLAVQRLKENDDVEFSNINTLISLGYDNFDIVNALKELEVGDYSHSVRDIVDKEPPFLHVFGKIISNRMIYIKLKMKEYPSKNVICVSFHYARKELSFPYTEMF